MYYTAPSEKVFAELKEKAIEVWNTFDNTYGYADKKVDRIKDLQNISDNFMTIVAMFDLGNQAKLSEILSEETKHEVLLRLINGKAKFSISIFS